MSDWFDEAGQGAPVDVPEVLDATWLELARDVVGAGALVSIGLSRDGGALAVTVTRDGRWRREWFRNGEELNEWMRAAVAACTGSGGVSASSGRVNGSRRSRGSSASL